MGIQIIHILYNFFLYSFIGWIYESLLVSIQKRTWVNRGFLNGPVIPIYGVGATIVYVFFWNLRGRYFVIFFGGMILATLLEYVTSYVMEILFHAKWWDYSDKKFNIKGRICLISSLFWGILSVSMVTFAQPAAVRLYHFIPKQIGLYIVIFASLIFTADTWITVAHLIHFDRILTELQRVKQELSDYMEITRIYESREELKRRLVGYRHYDISEKIRLFIETNKDKLIERNKQVENFDIKKLRTEVEIHLKDYAANMHSRIEKMNFVQRRILKAFPTLRTVRKELKISGIPKEIKKDFNKKRWLNMSGNFNEDLVGTTKSYLSGFLRVTLVGVLVLIQMGVILLLTYWLSESTIYIYMFIEIGSIFITVGLVNDNRNASYKIGWICVVLVLPLTGHIMYALWGKSSTTKKIENKILATLNHGNQYLSYNSELAEEYAYKYPTKSRMSRYMESQHFPLTKNNHITYYPMGEDTFEAIFEDIAKAEKFILMNFFIVGEGVLWDRIHHMLLKKIKEGVNVKFMYDDFGATLRTSKNFRRDLEAEGIETAVFNPIHKYTDKLYMNYRSHQKIIVIDGNIGYTGGMNLADEYVNLIDRFGTWKDNAVKVCGDAVWGLTVTFLQMWEICKNGERMDYNPYRPSMEFEANDVYCHVISDGPANNPNNPIESIYKQIINYAKKYIYITTPYLIIEDDMKQALITAVKSGVDVRIITPYIPDKKNVKRLTNYNYGQLLEAGIKIYEYKPGFIHAKTIINEDCGIVGTINMDYRSFYLHYECGLWMCSREVIDVIKEDLLKTMDISIEISYQEWKNRPWYLKSYQKILNVFSTLM